MRPQDDEPSSCATTQCGHSAAAGHDHAAMTGIGITFAIAAVATLCLAWVSPLLPGQTIAHSSSLAVPLYWVAFFCGGFFAAVDAARSLAHGRLTIDTLMVAAGIGAAWIGHLPEGALLLTLFSIGHAAEHYALGHAEKSIHALTAMRPTTASLIDSVSQQMREVPIDDVRIGDTVLVRPDGRVPVDGVVVSGESSIDQSPITGESIPVDKTALAGFDALRDDATLVAKDHQVFAGTINGSGSIHIQVTRKSSDSTLARFSRLIAEAKTQRSPTQRLTETFERRFVPAVMALVAVMLFAFVVVDESFSSSLYRAMAVLVAASPCALAIATPSAVLSAVARAGREGVLIKGGGPLEQLGRVTAVAFDKTGTLTTGRPEVAEVLTMPGVTRKELLATAAAVQQVSDHPLARAIVRANAAEPANAKSHSQSAIVSDVQRVSGQGVIAKLNGRMVAIGNAKLFDHLPDSSAVLSPRLLDAAASLRQQGHTITFVASDRSFLGVVGIIDTPRLAAKQVISALHTMGLRPLVMLSGDHNEAAHRVAEQLMLDEVKGDLLPEQKVAFVRDLTQVHVTAMVGDGANDAPAMAAASVSVAMGAAGSDVALETADVALMGDDLTKLPFAIALSRAANSIIRQNLWISLGMIAILIPATVLGLELGPAVILHEGSTLVVVANALRLLAFTYK